VAFWTAGGDRHHFKVPKPVEAIVADDIPADWLEDALFTEGVGVTPCC
jgi:hypothetical protein